MIDTVLLNGLWQGGLIVAIAALTTAFVPKHQAATRYAVWFAALIALAILPLVSVLHPAAIAALPTPVAHTAATPSLVTAQAVSASGSWLLAFWLAGVTIAFIRLALSFVRINGIIRGATPAPELGAGVFTSTGVDFPIAARLISPLIVIPAHLAATMDRADLDDIVRHERAHIERRDILANLIQRVIEALLFFNPWTYLIGRRLIAEREAACDDRAVYATGEADRYASCLARLAQRPHTSHAPLLTPSAIGSRRMLVDRIARLLDGKGIELKTNYVALGASTIAFAILAVLLQTSNGLAHTTISVAAASLPPNCWRDIKVVNAAEPDIPKSARNSGNLEAGVLVTVAADGHIVNTKLVKTSGNAAVDKATLNAANASTYSPAVSNCKNQQSTYYFHVETAP
jgi:beta-lactamase regulating signal transducer with metallopeptidase domain